MFTMKEPYYGILLSSMVRTPVKASICNTLGVTRDGNVFKLVYNPDYIQDKDVDTMLEILKHEVLHVAFNHFDIWEDKKPPQDIQQLRNIAADMEVNCYLDTSKVRGVNLIFPSLKGWEKCLGTREYFKRLYAEAQQKKQQQQAQQPQQPCNGGMGGNSQRSQQNSGESNQENQQEDDTACGGGQGQPSDDQQQSSSSASQGNANPVSQQEIPQNYLDELNNGQFDDHSQWPDDAEELEQVKQMVEDMLVFAADEVEKGCGKIPGEMAGKVAELRNRKKPKPVADWKRYVRRYLGNEFSEFIRKSKKRESRRFPDAAGNKHRRKSHILVAIDTSGSVSMPEYIEFFGQIRTLTQHATFHVVECDAAIQNEYDYRNKPNMTLHGGGGTDFQPVVDIFNQNKKKYDALVYFTDGYCNIPSDTPKETLWVVSSQGDQSDRKRYQVNGASVAFIPKKEEK